MSVGNLVSDGMFPIAGLAAFTGYVGNSWWTEPLFGDFKRNDIVRLLIIIAIVTNTAER